ncbi:hypothetical protein D3C83_12450 [compost metagenome]
MLNWWSTGRTPQPDMMSGLTRVALNADPKSLLFHPPQTSPADGVVALRRSQSTTRSLSVSVQLTDVLNWNVEAGFS